MGDIASWTGRRTGIAPVERALRTDDTGAAHRKPCPRSLGRDVHFVECVYCRGRFNLFAAAWCGHAGEPSKFCPHCTRCLCEHPSYSQPLFWKEAPTLFRKHGFERLFLLYI